MIERVNDSGSTGGTTESGVPSNDKQQPAEVRKQALRDLPNENNVTMTKPIGNSSLPKEKESVNDPAKVSGTKRPLSEASQPPSQTSSANGNLVYVRRKTESEAGKSSSVTTCSSNEPPVSVKVPNSAESAQNSSAQPTPQVQASKTTHVSESFTIPPDKPVSLINKSPIPNPLGKSENSKSLIEHEASAPVPHPFPKAVNNVSSSDNRPQLPHPSSKAGNNVSSIENKSMAAKNIPSTEIKPQLPQPSGKAGNIVASLEYKSQLPHPSAKPGNNVPSGENNSQVPHPSGMAVHNVSSAENKPQLLHPSGEAGNIVPSVENKSQLPHPSGNSGNNVSSRENKSQVHHPSGKTGSTVPSVENRSQLPHPSGKSGNNVTSAENKYQVHHSSGKTGNNLSSVESKPQVHHLSGKVGNNVSSAEHKSQLPHPFGKAGNNVSSVENRPLLPHPPGKSGNIVSSVAHRSTLLHPVGKFGNTMSSAEYVPSVSLTPKLDSAKESNTKSVQQTYTQPQMFMRDFDRSVRDHEDYLQMLRSLSSVELSRLAYDLEARSIQLSLEEAKEMARVEKLNVLGKTTRDFKSPTAQPYWLEK